MQTVHLLDSLIIIYRTENIQNIKITGTNIYSWENKTDAMVHKARH